jgi:16S rRNA (guanine(966)-N(2))-methyltransferase RsmD
LRVIAGIAKGRRIKAVRGGATRPITDRAKSALFSILGHAVMGSEFLDLFAGTGQVGIEALSRGASRAVFVERHRAATRTIRENLDSTRLAASATVVQADVFAYLGREPHPHDFVFVAPPQYRGLWSRTLDLLDDRSEWLQPGGLVIVQIHPREHASLPLTSLVLTDQRSYGSVMLCFYSRGDGPAPAG